MPSLRIAMAQINPVVGAFAANVGLIAGFLQEARQRGADLAVFPELCVCGYPPEDLLYKPRFLQDTKEALNQAAQATRGLTAVLGYAEEKQGRIYNSAAVIHDGRLLGSYRKMELPNYGVFDEKRYFTPGSGALLLDLGPIRVLICICEDIWVPGDHIEHSVRACQAQVAVNISASPFHAGKRAERRQNLESFARRTGSLVCYANLVGGQDELVFDGGSLIMDAQGRVLARGRHFGEDLLVCDLELPAVPIPAPVPAPDRLISLPAPSPSSSRPGSPPPPLWPPSPAQPVRSTKHWCWAPAITCARTASIRCCWGSQGASTPPWWRRWPWKPWAGTTWWA
ncbi:hypothetical protein DFAR_3960013 [Desulfarculales bacterium]